MCQFNKEWGASSSSLTPGKVLLFFIAASYVMDSSYGVVDTLFNPILSDYFGFTERETSYFFLGVMMIHVIGSLLL